MRRDHNPKKSDETQAFHSKLLQYAGMGTFVFALGITAFFNDTTTSPSPANDANVVNTHFNANSATQIEAKQRELKTPSTNKSNDEMHANFE